MTQDFFGRKVAEAVESSHGNLKRQLAEKNKRIAELEQKNADVLAVLTEARSWMTAAFRMTNSFMRNDYDKVMPKIADALCGTPGSDQGKRIAELEQELERFVWCEMQLSRLSNKIKDAVLAGQEGQG